MATEQVAVISIDQELESALKESVANLKVLQSRLEAYQSTCASQGSKLSRMERLLVGCSDEAKDGINVSDLTIGFVTFTDARFKVLAEVLSEKGSNR